MFLSLSVIYVADTFSLQFNEPATTDDFFRAILDDGPMLSRMAMSGQLAQPMFTVGLT